MIVVESITQARKISKDKETKKEPQGSGLP
jgi:hypothetical protein